MMNRISLLPFSAYCTGTFTEQYVLEARLLKALGRSIALTFEIIERNGIEIPALDSMLEMFHGIEEKSTDYSEKWDHEDRGNVEYYLRFSMREYSALNHDASSNWDTVTLRLVSAFISIVKAIYYCGYSGIAMKRTDRLSTRNQDISLQSTTDISEAEAMIVHLLNDTLAEP